MRKDTQAVLLLLVGGTLLKISLAGSYIRYVKPGLLPLLILSGLVLIAIAGITLWQAIQERPVLVAAGRASRAAEAVAVLAAEGVWADGGASAAKATPVRAGATDAPEIGVDEPRASGAGAGVPGASMAGVDSPGLSAEPGGAGPRGAEPQSAHDHGEPRVGWLLLVPALALLLLAPPALGSFQASRNGTALATGQDSDFAALPAGDPVRVAVLDYAARAVFDQGRSLTGRRVTLSGFVIAGPQGKPYLARLVVGCCAADARPVKVGLTGDIPANLRPDQWIEVEGAYADQVDRDPINNELIPYLQVTALRDIAVPDQQYES